MQNKYVPLISLSLIVPFVEDLRAQKCAETEIARQLSMTVEMLNDSDAAAPASVVYHFIVWAAKILGDPYLGSRVGMRMMTDPRSPVATVFRQSTSLGEFFQRISFAVSEMGGSALYRLEVEGKFTIWRLTRPWGPAAPTKQADATAVGGYATALKMGAGEYWDADQLVAITSDPALVPPDILPQASVLPGKDGVLLRFPTKWLFCKLNRTTKAQSSPKGSQLRLEQQALVDNVQQLLEQNISDSNFTANRAASLLGLPTWKLHSDLKEDGSSFSALKNELREKMAVKMLNARELTIRDIALKLGYKSASNFSRAFKKRSGFAPSDFIEKA